MLHIKPQDIGLSSVADLASIRWELGFGSRTSDAMRKSFYPGQKVVLFETERRVYVGWWRVYADGCLRHILRSDPVMWVPADHEIEATIEWIEGDMNGGRLR